MNNDKKITKKDLQRLYWRTQYGLQLSWNYEKMQGIGYCYSLIPILKKLYTTKEDMKKALKLHLGFFNSNPAMTHLIIGADVALEEEIGMSDPDAISGLKVGLMGPFAGVGDTIFVAIYRTIIFSISSYLALAGNVIGALIPIFTAAIIDYVRYRFTFIGYNQGKKIATGFASDLKKLTEGASILGLTVVGALVPSVVNVSVPFEYVSGDVSLKVQTMLDQILPGIVPLIVVFFSYWLLGRKKMSSTKLMLVLMVLGIILGNLQVLK